MHLPILHNTTKSVQCASKRVYGSVYSKHQIEFDGQSKIRYYVLSFCHSGSTHAAFIFTSCADKPIPFALASRPHLHSKICVINVTGKCKYVSICVHGIERGWCIGSRKWSGCIGALHMDCRAKHATYPIATRTYRDRRRHIERQSATRGVSIFLCLRMHIILLKIPWNMASSLCMRIARLPTLLSHTLTSNRVKFASS